VFVTSIYELALGSDYRKLHPRIQERFGFSSEDGVASFGQGVMERVWFAKWAAVPLYIGTWRNILFPNGGSQIPFTIENFAYKDVYGRETVTWNRKFKFPKAIRHFDATMVYSTRRRKIVDYLGNRQHLAVDLDVRADENGGIRIRSGDQRFYEGWLQFRFPRTFTGDAEVCEWFDDEASVFRISVKVDNPLLGTIFEYQGSFQARLIDTSNTLIPLDAKPLREENRE
jgi:hypothetical protein